MTTAALLCLLVSMGAAITDWVAVATGHRHLEYVAKPAVMVALLGLGLTLVPGSSASDAARPWFVAALALSLVGDVLLMLPSDRFVGGLVAFLLAHVAYIVGLALIVLMAGVVAVGVMLGLVVVGSTVLLVAWPIVKAVRVGRPRLVAPVVAYLVVISIMVVVALRDRPAGGDRRRAASSTPRMPSSPGTGSWHRSAGAASRRTSRTTPGRRCSCSRCSARSASSDVSGGGSPGSGPVATGIPDRLQSLYEPT